GVKRRHHEPAAAGQFVSSNRPQLARQDPTQLGTDMATLNHLKIVFTGTPGAGKTTAIGALSDTPPVVTDVRNTDASLGKENTTVGLDFGQVDLGDGQFVRLFGTPGQLR